MLRTLMALAEAMSGEGARSKVPPQPGDVASPQTKREDARRSLGGAAPRGKANHHRGPVARLGR